jgi:TonB family protein
MEACRPENTMNPQRIRLVAALLLFGTGMFGAVHALASDVKIVANPSVRADSITPAELRSVFLQDRRSLNDGSHVEPVLAKGGTVHEAFLRQYVGKSDDDLRTYYRTLVFTGTGTMPKFLDSDAEIIRYVAHTKGAVGYVSIDFPTNGVKVLAVSQAGTGFERELVTRVEPEYPVTLQRLQIGGTVRLIVTISAKGSVEGVELLGGNPILAEPAIKAVKQWVYTPGPSRSMLEVSIPFIPK